PPQVASARTRPPPSPPSSPPPCASATARRTGRKALIGLSLPPRAAGGNGTSVLSAAAGPAPPRGEPAALGPQRGLRAVGHAERAEDRGQVRLDRLLADLQAPRDQLVGQALDQQVQDLRLTRRQLGGRVGLGPRGEDRARRAWVQRRLAARRRPDALGDL